MRRIGISIGKSNRVAGSAITFLIALATAFPLTVLTWSGVAGVQTAYYDVARALGANPRFLILKVAIPAALPHVFVGLFMGLGSSFAVLVAAEMLGVKSGLGWYLQWAQGWAAYANMYGALLVMALMCSALATREAVTGTVTASRVASAEAVTGTVFGADLDVRDIGHGFVLHSEYLPVLSEVSFKAKAGEFVALLGPSGCGAEVTDPDPSRVVVFQDPTLYPWRTVWRNASLGLETRGLLKQQSHRVDEALPLVGLEKFAKAFPHQLSGGMAQRASLARALVNDPSLLILDEPLGKLNSLTRLTMQGELTLLWQRRGFTVLMVTHDVEEALLLANRVIVFSDRPARIRADLAVDLPYPRHRDHPELLRLRREALELLGLARDW